METQSNEIKVLHVEDSDADAKLVEMTLKKSSYQNYQLSRAADIDGALAFLDAQAVDLILLDLNLPDSQGLDTLKHLRSRSPNNAIVVITGSDDESTALLAVQHGAQDYLVKDELTPRTAARAIRYSIERHRHDQQMIELANIDMTTGLPNRARFMDYLDHAIARTQGFQQNLSLLFIDCDHFKIINDSLGHAKGDEFLAKFGAILKNRVRSSDFIARLGGDEFIIAINISSGPIKSPLMVAEKILETVREGVHLSSGEKLDARCSIGITNYTGSASAPSPDKLIHEADSAMYLSKRRGGDCISFFDQKLEQKAERRLSLLRDISPAIRNGEFFLNYQPIISGKTGIVEGFETLLRWKNQKQEYISPVEFIPLLEETGLIHTVGKWLIERACDDFQQLQSAGLLSDNAWLSVNISPIQLQNKFFLGAMRDTISKVNMKPGSLHLEITESLLVEHSEYVLSILDNLKKMGCKLAIDDFGVGYSSMYYLKTLPIDTLKIDRSFILNCGENESDKAITKAMISLAHNLNMKVIAEGIETANIASFLQLENCDYLQGFYYSRPVAFDLLFDYLKSENDINHKGVCS